MWSASCPPLTSIHISYSQYYYLTLTLFCANAAVIFLVEGCGQNNLGKNWGDGLATDPAIVSQRGINSAASLFSQLLKRSYVNQVVVAPHVYPPSISQAKEETQVSFLCRKLKRCDLPFTLFLEADVGHLNSIISDGLDI